MRRVLALVVRRLRFRSLDRGEFSSASKRPLDNPDAMATVDFGDIDSSGGHSGGLPPPGYVKSYDEGRPRK
jgi:hypothetical protein